MLKLVWPKNKLSRMSWNLTCVWNKTKLQTGLKTPCRTIFISLKFENFKIFWSTHSSHTHSRRGLWMYSTVCTVPMAGTLQTLILTPPTTKTPSLRHRSRHFPSNRALFHIPCITFNRDRSFRRPITALDRSDQVRPPPIPSLSITCFSYLFGYRENVGKK